ncbi:unnamed protein product [Pleuronectes platessa]|uniref:Uncharacterized protein n=1 Tax=Pleuronectes platessa TaxID=8262 RepID=A0A9N7Z1B9_PLEPL|nr:unnamed protein product [Pleuronectes platessa]
MPSLWQQDYVHAVTVALTQCNHSRLLEDVSTGKVLCVFGSCASIQADAVNPECVALRDLILPQPTRAKEGVEKEGAFSNTHHHTLLEDFRQVEIKGSGFSSVPGTHAFDPLLA